MISRNIYALSVTFLYLAISPAKSAPQAPPFQPGPFGVPFPAGNATSLSPTGSAGFPTASGVSNANASMCQVQQVGLGPVDGGPPNPDVYSTACSCSNLYSAHASTLTSTFQNRLGPVTETLTTFTDATYQPPDNCCIKCWISAQEVQVIYWPVETDTPRQNNDTATTGKWNATSTLRPAATITAAPTPYSLVQDGFTFVSPSVYVAYRDLQAYAVCPSFGNAYSRGKSYNTTIAYGPNEISTSICTTGSQGIQPIGYGHFAAINYTEYQYSTSAWSQCAKEIEAGSGGSRSIEGPFYSIPGDVSLIDPAWHTCSAVFNGVFDPPQLLNPAPALATGGAADPAPAAPTAEPASAPAPALVPPTPTPAPNKPPAENPPVNNPPTNNPPTNNPPTNNPPTNNSPADGSLAINNEGPSSPESNNQAPVVGGSATIMVIPQPAQPAPTPIYNPVVMNNPSPPPPITANGVTISRAPASLTPGDGSGAISGSNGNTGEGGAKDGSAAGVVVSGTTYSNGASTTLPGGAPLSVASDHIILGRSSIVLPPAASSSPLIIAGNPISRVSNGDLVIGTSTIAPGAAPTTAYGHAISVGQSSAVIDGSTYALPSVPSPTAATAITLSNGDVLTAGGTPAIVSGTTIALASNGASLLINGYPFSIPPTAPGATISSNPALTTIGGQTFFAASAGFAIGSQTITPGGTPVTISGTVVSLGPSGKLVIGSETNTLPPGGSGIAEMVGGIAINAPTASGAGGGLGGTPQAFTGDGARSRLISPYIVIVVALGPYLF